MFESEALMTRDGCEVGVRSSRGARLRTGSKVTALAIASAAASACGATPPEPVQGPPVATAPAAPTSASSAPTSVVEKPTAATPGSASSAVASATPTAPVAPAAPAAQGACSAGMVQLAGGKFKSSYFKAEMSVTPFCLDVKEVTTAQYTACVDAGKCDKNLVTICDPSTFGVDGKGDLPMVCIDAGQAATYCKAQGKRIVSDVEWEWAARGGDEGRLYPWGNDDPAEQLCWSGKSKREGPCPVGSFPGGANPQGIVDLSGNVYEWTTTSNDATSTYRVGRGGSWKDATADVFKNTRPGGFKTTYRCGFLGIRCATPVP
jgi:formylglycine-generating enzyme